MVTGPVATTAIPPVLAVGETFPPAAMVDCICMWVAPLFPIRTPHSVRLTADVSC
jgi:hypothetical protein